MSPREAAPKVLVVEDDADLRALLAEEVGDLGFEAVEAASAEDALDRLARRPVDVIVSDLRLPGVDGMELLARTRGLDPAPSFVVITAFGSVPQAVEALRAGAADFLTKPLNHGHFRLSLERILEQRSLQREVRRYRKLMGRDDFHGMVGRSEPMRRVFEQIVQLARSRGPVLILGESGTGKELAARAIHAESDRSEGPFVAVNCAGIPRELIESEFFGHREGAFTGASRSRRGLFEEADGGTLLLDEIAEMSLGLQSKLLRVLQEGQLRPVGSTSSVAVDVRVIAASHRDLEAEVAEGRFREDLFYRLETFQLHLPPLRERGDDLDLLTARFLQELSLELGQEVPEVSPPALRALRSHRFAGNVRELRNALERAVAFCNGGPIRPDHLPARIRDGESRVDGAQPGGIGTRGDRLPSLAEVEARYIRQILDRLDGNKRRAARVLGISRRTLYRKLEGLGLS